MQQLKSLVLIIVCLIGSMQLTYAQKTKIGDKEKKEIIAEGEKDFWETNSKEIYDRAIPEKWNGESSVVLERFIQKEYFRNGKNYLRLVNREHEVIKILSTNALEDYSTLYFPDIENSSFLYHLDIKIIKADGTEKLVNVKENSITEEQGGTNYNKIAVSDLEVGDIIDYFRLFEFRAYFPKTSYDAFDADYMLFGDDDPIINYTFNLVMGPATYVNARLDNLDSLGFKRSTFNKDDLRFTKFSLQLQNLEEYDSDVRWFYPYAEIPNLRYQIFIDNHYESSNMKQNLSLSSKMNDAPNIGRVGDYIEAATQSYPQKYFYAGFKDYIKEHEKSFKEMTKKEIALDLYYYYRAYYVISDWEYNSNRKASNNFQFVQRMKYVLDELNVPNSTVIAFNKRYTGKDKFLLTDELFVFLRIDLDEPVYLLNPTAFLTPNEMYSEFQGTEAYLNTSSNYVDKDAIKLPTTDIIDNGHNVEVALSFPVDFEDLKVNRKYTIKGTNKEFYQYRLINLFKYVDDSNKEFKIESREDAAKKKYREDIEAEIDEYIADKEKEIEEFKVKDINDDYGFDIEEVDDFKMIQYGNTEEEKHLIYSDEFTVSDVAQKVGQNYLLPIGLFMGSQVAIEEEERERDYNIYMDTPREYIYNISLTIPDGYEVTDVDHLNISVVNSTGKFVSKVSIDGNKMNISTEKIYNHYKEPKENWREMMDFLDAAYKFTQQKVLLRKK